jgi:hypothetical protein
MRVEQQRVMENVIRKLFTDPQRVERLIANLGKEDK